MGSLKSFIKAVRKAKTIADEKAVVSKESAAIRTAFRDPNFDQTERRINISKLLYLYIIGEKTHFGQVECLKLLASPRFADKRLGYLATMLLLDENQEVLTLLTNSLDNDMQHPNAYVVSLALTCLGNIASPELARDLHGNVDKIITTNNSFLRKKSCIVAAKLIDRDPELSEIFLPKVPTLLGDKQAGPLLGCLRLIQALYFAHEENRPNLIKTIPKIVSHLKRISTSGYLPDYDVLGISDPFLQATLLSTLRILASDKVSAQEYLDQINDILTQVASNIESGKNAAHAVLYECVKTIFAIESDQSLRILGVNLLGKFLSTKDNNTRYVALDSLLTVVSIEPLAVQRQRTIIVNCLSDGDVSIRRRALELSFAILNEQNIRVLAREILSFLEVCTDKDLQTYVTSQLTIAASRYAPNEKWHFDTLIRMLKLAGNHITSDIVSNIFALILQCSNFDLKRHIMSRLFASCLEDSTQFGLSLITVWTLGEYADLILNTEIELNEGKNHQTVTDDAIINLLDQLINNSTYSEIETIQLVTYILTAAIKLSIKLKKAEAIEKLRLIINSKTHDNNLEIQVRAVEYQELFNEDLSLKKGLLAKMPAPEIKHRESVSLFSSHKQNKSGNTNNSLGMISNTDDLLLDLMDDIPNPNQTQTSSDILLDIFGSSNGAESSKQATSTKPTSSPKPVSNGQKSSSFSSSASPIEVFSNGNISVLLVPVSFGNGIGIIEAEVRSVTSSSITQFQLLIAVPKSQKLTISSNLGGDTLTSGSVIKQTLKVVGKPDSKIKFRVRARYLLDGRNVEDQFDYSGFDLTL
ncbi:uncharacterized protein PRCAT00005470001 [Priceomyces carsonii]|uniref:uncharacterized protein n=1 Tax=Priceomyces carsonii TaxID=28549 RepID=UPI002ED879C2|nr:unnamed protein product [Priceomyces carsonii]